MSKNLKAGKTPMTRDAAARIQSATAEAHDGRVPKGSSLRRPKACRPRTFLARLADLRKRHAQSEPSPHSRRPRPLWLPLAPQDTTRRQTLPHGRPSTPTAKDVSE